MINLFDSMDICPEEGIFFLPHHFYLNLKETIITNEDYNFVKKMYQAMKVENLGELNKLYNFQDTIILCEIFENQSQQLQKLSNVTQKSKSENSFSGCVHRDKSKCLTAQLKLNMSDFLKNANRLIGSFSCINTSLAFNLQILLPKDKINDDKLIFDLRINNVN